MWKTDSSIYQLDEGGKVSISRIKITNPTLPGMTKLKTINNQIREKNIDEDKEENCSDPVPQFSFDADKVDNNG
jgi:hypothetical protein